MWKMGKAGDITHSSRNAPNALASFLTGLSATTPSCRQMAMGFNKGMFLLFVTFGVASAFAPSSKSGLKGAVDEWIGGMTSQGSFGNVDISEWDVSVVDEMG